MKHLIAALLLLSSGAAYAKDEPPIAPSEPDWSQVKSIAEAKLTEGYFDPKAAQIEWLGGWHWSFIRKTTMGGKTYGWLGCANVNGKNRLGGYVGAEARYVLVRDNGKLDTGYTSLDAYHGCAEATAIPLQAAFAVKGEAPVDVADELMKLAKLRDAGVLTPVEFEARKAKLLAR